MIHEFTIRNVLSFREAQTLSFEASSNKDYEDLYCVPVKPNLKLLKLGIVYGANASGKSNLLTAFSYLRGFILKATTDKFERIGITPFLLDAPSRTENSELRLSFFLKKKQYIYTLIFNQDHIVTEKLVYYPSTQPALIFHRTYNKDKDISEIEFGKKLAIANQDKIVLASNTIKNTTVLSIYATKNMNIDLLENVVNWFKSEVISEINPRIDLTDWANKQVENSATFRNSVVKILKQADFNIADIIFEDTTAAKRQVTFLHTTDSGNYPIPFDLQSAGTKRYYGLGSILHQLVKRASFLAIDELEDSLHVELINHFLKTFLVNTKTSQLLCTTHNTHLLMADFIRRDVIWFCEKNKAGATELFSASDFGLHKNVSLFNAYKIGKLGAKPEMGDIYLQ